MLHRWIWLAPCASLSPSALAACSAGQSSREQDGPGRGDPATLSPLAQLGRQLFNDTGLSASPTAVAAGAGGNPYIAAGTFYAAADGSAERPYNDRPAQYDAHVKVGEIPYTPPSLAGGRAPTLEAQQIDQRVALLCTLTDGYDPVNPAACVVPAPCQPAAANAEESSR